MRPLAVVERDHRVELARRGAEEDRVRRERARRAGAGPRARGRARRRGASSPRRRTPLLAGVRVQRREREARAGEAEVVAERPVGDDERLRDALGRERAAELAERATWFVASATLSRSPASIITEPAHAAARLEPLGVADEAGERARHLRLRDRRGGERVGVAAADRLERRLEEGELGRAAARTAAAGAEPRRRGGASPRRARPRGGSGAPGGRTGSPVAEARARGRRGSPNT